MYTHTNTRRSHTKTKSVTNTGSSLLPPGSWPRTAPRVPSYARAGKHTQNRQTDSNFLKSAWSDCRKHVQSWRFFNLRYHLRNLPKSALKKAMRYLTFLLHKKPWKSHNDSKTFLQINLNPMLRWLLVCSVENPLNLQQY